MPGRSLAVVVSGMLALAGMAVLLCALTLAGNASAAGFSEFMNGLTFGGLTPGPGGAVWFTFAEPSGTTGVGRITASGAITLYPLASYGQIVAGADGNLWIDAGIGKSVDRVTPSGVLTSFPGGGGSITTGPAGDVWLVSGDQLISVNPQGAMTSSTVSLPGFLGIHASLLAVASERDGNLWATAGGSAGHAVLKLSTAGQVLALTRVPAVAGAGQGLEHTIVVAPNGDIWFVAGEASGLIGMINPATGRFHSYPISSQLRTEGGAFPGGIAVGPDRNIWFTWTSGNGNQTGPYDFGVGRLTPGGLVTFFSADQGGGVNAEDIVSNAGRLWFTVNPVPAALGTGPDLLSYTPPSRPCLVPQLADRSITIARRLLRARNCQLGQVTRPTRRRCPDARLVIARQQPHAGSRQAGLTDVQVRLACWSPRVSTHNGNMARRMDARKKR